MLCFGQQSLPAALPTESNATKSAASPRAAWEEAQGWYSMGTDPGPHSPFDQPFYILLNMAVGGE